jgi:hypothetical protein
MSFAKIRNYFNAWRNIVDHRRYDKWCVRHQEELDDIQFAMENDEGAIY